MPDPVDLRSDTVTEPTPAMRRVMAEAEVGDDVLGDDPTVNALQDAAAGLFGRDSALFCPSGVMANQLALRAWAAPATEVVIEADAHIVDYEDGAGAVLAGVQFRTVPALDGLLAPEQVADAIRPDAYHLTPTSLVCLEQTHNRRGGTVYPLDQLARVAAVAHERGVNVYLDGARVFNALTALEVAPAVLARHVDGLMFSLSKGLGAPVGSVLVGDADAVTVARRWRRRYGGAMRQAGIVAAAGLYALRHHVERLAEDHANARMIADIVGAPPPPTNIVYVDTGGADARGVAADLAAEGILVVPFDAATIRLVTHLGVDGAACRRAGEALAKVLTASG